MKGLILKSSCIYTAGQEPFSGAIVIEGNIISGITGNDVNTDDYDVFDLKDKTICAGFGDTHTFFTGYYIQKPGVFEEMVDEIPEYLENKEDVKAKFKDYMKMLNSHGITSIKEMTFDDSYGLKEILRELEDEDELTLRIEFMSQPVKYPADIEYGLKTKTVYNSDRLAFSGFNQMTDGLIVSEEADLLYPYEGKSYTCKKDISYEDIERQVLEADKNGLRFTLHSEGDASLKQILDIYDKCDKDENGRLKNRHGITDLELTALSDRKRMAVMGVFAECYVQMLKTDDAENWVNDITGKTGTRMKEYLNFRSMKDEGVMLAGATDLPFMIPDIPESIYHGVFANAKDDKKVNPQNALTLREMLDAWTIGSQYAMGKEDKLGTIEKGKLADIVVFDKNIFRLSEKEFKDVNVEMTITDGKIVYRREGK